jgi:hypothetical protein
MTNFFEGDANMFNRRFFGGQPGRRPGRHFALALAMVCGVAVLGGLVMLLWNWLMPALFSGVGIIDYWQALGLLLLSKILFGGGRGFFRGHRHHPDSMTEEEREQLKRHFKSRWESRSACHGRDDTNTQTRSPEQE